MKRFGMIGLLFVGFVAGMFYVYSCGGGGGSSAMAEITDVSGLETRLDAINASIQGIEINNSTDMSGLTSALGSLATAISGIETKLDNINTSIQGMGGESAIKSQILSITGVGNGAYYDFPGFIDTTGYNRFYISCSNSIDDPLSVENSINQYVEGMLINEISWNNSATSYPIYGNGLTLSVHNTFGGTADISCMIRLQRELN